MATGVAADGLLAEIAALAATARRSQSSVAWVDPEIAFVELLGGERHAAWLDAGFGARSGWSYLCSLGDGGYLLTGDPSAGSVEIEQVSTSRSARLPGTILDALGAVGLPAAPDPGSLGSFALGWVGFLGYESGARALGAPFAHSAGPDSAMLFVDRVIAFDHENRRTVLTCFAGDGADSWLETTALRLAELAEREPGKPFEPPAAPSPGLAGIPRHSPARYLSLIKACQAEITEGESYQLCLTNQISVKTDEDPLAVYLRLRRLNPGPRGGLIVTAEAAIASSSPELFLRIDADRQIETRPIKGTRPRGDTPEADAALRKELARSEKERAENVMIVDLMRNDLSRVAQVGTVDVPTLFAVEEYANVFQLVSTVTARLAPGMAAIAAVASAFPAGSMTGAPKARAMKILWRLERGPRGAYAGAFGYLGIDGRLELSMTIRSIVFDRVLGTAEIGTGGGITALSEPQAEVEEMVLKSLPMLKALGARLVTS